MRRFCSHLSDHSPPQPSCIGKKCRFRSQMCHTEPRKQDSTASTTRAGQEKAPSKLVWLQNFSECLEKELNKQNQGKNSYLWCDACNLILIFETTCKNRIEAVLHVSFCRELLKDSLRHQSVSARKHSCVSVHHQHSVNIIKATFRQLQWTLTLGSHRPKATCSPWKQTLTRQSADEVPP